MGYTKAISDSLKKIACKIDNAPLIATMEAILEQLQNQDQSESLDTIPFCDPDTGVITGFLANVYDESTQIITPVYFDAVGTQTTVAPLGAPCVGSIDFEFKFFETEKCLPDGTKVKEVLCISYKDGIEVSTSTFWIVDGVKITTEPLDIIECEVCDPQTESFLGDNATLTQFNNITVIIPKCCEATITTSAGTIIIPSIGGAKVMTEHFDCFVSDYQITSTCVDEITTILTKTK